MSPDKKHPEELSGVPDKALLPSAENAGTPLSKFRVFAVFFVVLALVAAIYVHRHAADFSRDVYDETAGAVSPAALAPKTFNPAEYGKKLFATQCVNCHQFSGQGVPGSYPPLAGSEWVLGPKQRLIRIVVFGLNGEVTVQGKTYTGAIPMPAYGKVPHGGFNWRDDQIAAVLTYIRQDWGNKESAVTAEEVAEQRTKISRNKPWTIKELLEQP